MTTSKVPLFDQFLNYCTPISHALSLHASNASHNSPKVPKSMQHLTLYDINSNSNKYLQALQDGS
jgi:hypothetical protein